MSENKSEKISCLFFLNVSLFQTCFIEVVVLFLKVIGGKLFANSTDIDCVSFLQAPSCLLPIRWCLSQRVICKLNRVTC